MQRSEPDMSWPFNSPDSFDGGFWTSKHGSTEWCEENYLHSPYIAETTNTISNLSYILLALYGIRHCLKQELPTRFVLCNLCLLLVGLGSASYHATLRVWAQVFDELPMLYFVTYTVFDTAPASNRRPFLVPASLLALMFAWTAVYTRIQTPIFHETSFALLLIFTTIRVLFLLHSPALLSKPALSRQVRMLYYQGSAMFVSGFVIWNIENWYCLELRAWRTDMGWPATWLAQGHAYWHIATGVGAYRMIVASELLFLGTTRREDAYEVTGSLFPVVREEIVRRD